jgi:hypothetical protein
MQVGSIKNPFPIIPWGKNLPDTKERIWNYRVHNYILPGSNNTAGKG